jgi:hypothetical protein
MNSTFRKIAQAAAIGAGAVAAGYAGIVAWNRFKYGRVTIERNPAHASLLDHFIPEPEVVASHHIDIAAPAAAVLDAARELQMLDSVIARTLFKLRELALGGEPDTRTHPGTLLQQMQSIGWVVRAETPEREIVLGAVTKPWEAAPKFRSVAAEEFAAFAEPGYVKIVFSLRAEPDGDERSVFLTETRAVATDAEAKAKFRRYWSYVAPGVHLIRVAMLRPVKCEAERRVQFVAA